MAVIQYITPTLGQGSEYGTTYLHRANQQIMRTRNRPKPVRSNRHTNVCNLITVLSEFWESPLTDAQRIAWGHYAYSTPLADGYGNPRYVKGYAHYMRSNRPRLQHGLPRIDDAPTTTGIPDYTDPTITTETDNSAIYVEIDASDDWQTEDNAAMLLWISRPDSPSRTTPLEVYQQLGRIDGSASSPAGGIYTFLPPQLLPTQPTAIWVRTAVTRADARYTS